jgi:tRNA pseudouridine55 synthase
MAHFGVLNVNKPAGCTSRDVVDRVERLCRPAKAGHAGTLDPLATGVLVICVGQATRLIQYVQRMRKLYSATFLFGRFSATDDTQGPVTVLEDPPEPSRAAIEQAVPQFLGTISQRPPAHSAVKIGGRRAYKLARRGVAVELAPRTVTIHDIRLLRYEYPELNFEIECGSGTYVRALGRDLAAALGTSAIMSRLERTAVGGFRVAETVLLEDLNAETLCLHLQPALAAVSELPRLVLNDAQIAEIRHGRSLTIPAVQTGALVEIASECAAVDTAGRLVAILRQRQPGEFWPDRNLV